MTKRTRIKMPLGFFDELWASECFDDLADSDDPTPGRIALRRAMEDGARSTGHVVVQLDDAARAYLVHPAVLEFHMTRWRDWARDADSQGDRRWWSRCCGFVRSAERIYREIRLTEPCRCDICSEPERR